MKKCLKHILLVVKLAFLTLHFLTTLFGFSMCVFAIEEASLVADARCIHDHLQFAIKDQSPQSYDGLTNLPLVEQTAIETTTSITNQSIVRSAEKIDFHENISTLRDDPVRTAANTRTEIKIIHSSSNATLISSTLSNGAHRENASSFSTNLISNFSTSTTQIVSQNFSDIFTALSHVNVTFQPLRLMVWYDFSHMPFANNSIEFERLKQGLDRSVEVIKNLLSVIPVKGRLLLKRLSACGSFWQDDSSNSQKCGRKSLDYDGEKCLDDFQVPDPHLGGFATYDKDGLEPNQVHFKDGRGIPDTDTVIYVRAHNSRRCTEGNTIAYASSCQLDQFYRPIAGFANFCPGHLSSKLFDANKFYLTVLHELFHVLGFSKKLFKNFQTCKILSSSHAQAYSGTQIPLNDNLTLVCEKRKRVVDFLDGWHRVVSPHVMKEAYRHFNCSNIGGPLEGAIESPTVSSHWESRFLQPSIMTSSIGLPHLTVLDPITLALFNDTGWYKVNMSLASPLFWGRGAGCQFGSVDYCGAPNNSFFCSTSSLAHGCHYLHLDKGVCKSDEFLDSCKIYKPESGGECWDPTNQKNAEPWKGESFNVNSRCFISNISPKQRRQQGASSRSKRNAGLEEGRCYEQRCNDTNTLEIRVQGSSWVLCKSREKVEIPGYDGFIICPPTQLMCNASISSRTRTRVGSAVCVKIKMAFPGLANYVRSLSRDDSVAEKSYVGFMQNLAVVINKLITENNTSVAPRPHASGDVIRFGLKSLLANTRACTQAVKGLKSAFTKGWIVVPLGEEKFPAKQFESTYTLQPCPNQSIFVGGGNNGGDYEKPKHTPGRGVVSPGVIAAAAVGGVCVTVFAAVWFILYAKSAVPNAVGPVTGMGPEVSYQNARSSPPSLSESGSVGQIQFSL